MVKMDDVLPNIDHVRGLLSDVFGDNLTASWAAKVWDKSVPFLLSIYEDEWGTPRRMLAIDQNLAIALGAALSMLPPDVVKEAIAKKTIPDNVLANVREVCNICVNFFMLTADYRLIFKKMELAKNYASSPLSHPGLWTLTFDVAMSGYGSGKILLAYIPNDGEELDQESGKTVAAAR